ncbi:MAG: 30S ribosomal protein S8 [Alphaproteobacteria bacterium]|nr:30S ribosomal protein S8 [Alphaproteobacteria bacterium]MBL0718179.1 30S ribosomal protein S8 [Alphaproteobacteria bacterium]
MDKIADLLTQIRNAQLVFKEDLNVPASKFRISILDVLLQNGFISGFKKVLIDNKNYLNITLKYVKNKGVIQKIEKISKPGLRVYAKSDSIPRFRNGIGLVLVSTSKGIMTDSQARKLNLGGEVICQVC